METVLCVCKISRDEVFRCGILLCDIVSFAFGIGMLIQTSM